MKSLSFFALLLLFAALVSTGCNEDGCTDPFSVNYDPDANDEPSLCVYPQADLVVQQKVGAADIAYGSTYQINGLNVKIDAVNMYLSNVEIVSEGGTEQSSEMPYYLVDAAGDRLDLGTFNAGQKQTLRFTVGITDSSVNHADPTLRDAEDPLSFKTPSMHWNWNSGYIFLRIDGEIDTDGDGVFDATLRYHLGTLPLARDVSLSLNQNFDREQNELRINFDLASLLEGLDLTQEDESFTMTGDNPPLARTVADRIADAFSVE